MSSRSKRRAAKSPNPKTSTGSSTPPSSFVRTPREAPIVGGAPPGRDIPACGSAIPYQPGPPDFRAIAIVAFVALGIGLAALVAVCMLARLLP
jgi:hypothetical protein